MTLVEVAIVVVLIGVLSLLAVNRIEHMVMTKQRAEIRRLLVTWELLYNEALARGNAYRLIIDLDKGSYYVRREVVERKSAVRQVDYLANLRTRREKERREKAAEDDLRSMDEEFALEDARQAQDLETLFYQSLFADPEGSVELRSPLISESLADEKFLSNGIEIKSIKTEKGKTTEGKASIRFSPRGTSEFAVIHFVLEGKHSITALLNPWTGEAQVQNGEVDFEWTLDER